MAPLNTIEVVLFFVVMLLGYDIPKPSECHIDQCNGEYCSVETPEGWVDIERRPDYYEGKEVECPMWLIEPT